MRVAAIIQARTNSTRLPAKVLRFAGQKPVLEHVVTRAKRAKLLDDIIVATTTSGIDDAIATLCTCHRWNYYRGDEQDVLDRYYRAATLFGVDIVVRLTGDCPLIDPDVIDRIVGESLSLQPIPDYTSNVEPRTYPRGLDVEVVPFPTLETLWRTVHDTTEREHVTLHMRRHPEKFTLHNVENEKDYSYMRWVLDTEEDMLFACRVHEHFGLQPFGTADVLNLLKEYPNWTVEERNGEET